MLCEWMLREEGNFPTVFCLKINYGSAFRKPPKIRYKGGKVNWIDNIDSDAFFVNEVIDLYVDHYVCKEPMNVDHYVSKVIILYDTINLDKFLDNDVDEVLDDVSEDEWLQESLRKLPQFSQCGGQSSNNVDNVVQASNNVANVVQASNNVDNSDFIVDEDNLIHDVDVDMQDFNNIYANFERMGCEESVEEMNEVFHVEEDIDFKDFKVFHVEEEMENI
ncbi:hypothetical protein Tco_0001809 [Tanacetum coccineum]